MRPARGLIAFPHLSQPCVALRFCWAVHFVAAAQDFFVELADAGFGNGVNEDDVVRKPPFGDARAQVFEESRPL